MKINSCTPNLMVKSVNESIAYYQEHFGFELVDSVPQTGDYIWAQIRHGNVTLMFQSEASLREEFAPMKDISMGGSLTLFITLEGLSDVYAKVKDQIDMVVDLHETFYGMNEITFRDLNGYYITLAEPIQK